MVTKRRKGFTLVELVIVIAVIAILASILIPTFMTVVEKSRYSADIQAARNMSTLAKTAAINGATDASGNDMDISMNEPRGVIAFLKANGNSLDPKSKDSAFWYDRATGDVKIIKNDDMFKTGGSAEKLSAALPIKPLAATDEKKFTQDCLEALSKDNPAYVYIDQSPKAPVSVAINTINNLVPAGKDFATTLAEMDASFTANISGNTANAKALKKVLNVTEGSTASPAYGRLLDFSPDKCLYISNTGAYTSNKFTGATVLEHALFTSTATTFGSWLQVAPEELKVKALTFKEPINIPVAIKTFATDAMATIDPSAKIIVNTQYSELDLAKCGCKSTIVDNTGKIQITYKTLQYDTITYGQYGVSYNNCTMNETTFTDAATDKINYVSGFDALSTLTGNLENVLTTGYSRPTIASSLAKYKKAKSIYAVPTITILGKLNDNTDANLQPITGTEISMDFKYFSRNSGNLTVMYGSIIANGAVYKIQDIAYIKAVSTYTISRNGTNTFVVSDPLAGGYYYNLAGITVDAIDDKGKTHQMKQQEYGSSKGDFELKADSAGALLPKIEKIYVKDLSRKVILVQYV